MTESAVCTNSHRSYVPLRSDGTPHPTRSHQGARQNIRPSGNVDSTPGLDPRVQCVQLSFCSRWMHSFTPTSLHDRNISHYREVIARHGTQQYSWLCCTMRVRMTTTPAHTPGIPSPPPSGSSLLRGPARLSLAMVPSPSSKRKSSRRLPSYLRNQAGAEPVGELRRLREEAANAAIERDRLHQEPSQPSQPSAGTGQAKTRGRGEGGKRFPHPGLSTGAGAGNDEPEHPIQSHGLSSSSLRQRLLAEPEEQAQTGRAKTRGWARGESGFRALVCPLELELVTLNLNNPKGHMAPPHPARGSDRWKNQVIWRRMGRAP